MQSHNMIMICHYCHFSLCLVSFHNKALASELYILDNSMRNCHKRSHLYCSFIRVEYVPLGAHNHILEYQGALCQAFGQSVPAIMENTWDIVVLMMVRMILMIHWRHSNVCNYLITMMMCCITAHSYSRSSFFLRCYFFVLSWNNNVHNSFWSIWI
jgi:hypothetical protein